MPARQISDEEDRWIQQQIQTVRFIESIYNDPKLNKKAKALIKEKYPALQIPDYDIETNVERRLAKDKEEREAEKERKAREEEDARIAKMRDETQKKHSFTSEAMKKLEDLMVERNIGDYEAAALLMSSKEPKASEPTYSSPTWDFDKRDGFAEIAKDPERWGRNEIMRAIHNDQERARNG
jgi:hypothetical protein